MRRVLEGERQSAERVSARFCTSVDYNLEETSKKSGEGGEFGAYSRMPDTQRLGARRGGSSMKKPRQAE